MATVWTGDEIDKLILLVEEYECILLQNISFHIHLLLGVLNVCANFGENRSRNATVKVLADGHTDRQTDRRKRMHTLTHANRF